jgi:hypothetical protein
MARIQFGTGNAYFVPVGGNIPTLATPQYLLTLQDLTIDTSAAAKDLRGQFQYPDDVAISDRKTTFKTGTGRMDIDAYNNLAYGETAITAGGTPQAVQEAHTIPATAPYTITVTNSASVPLKDLGVQYAATGQKLTKVPSITGTGQYMYSAGTYTYSPADTGLGVLISYNYTLATGRILTINNHPQGYGPKIEVWASLPYQESNTGVPNYIHLYQAIITKVGTPLKRADYLITDFEGEAYANAAGVVMDIYED